jgi:alkylation response protein AidB-like acyl-CoA dehydrogenase
VTAARLICIAEGVGIVTIAATSESVLPNELLDACAERAAGYDLENRFFTEDFDELRRAGYLLLAVPAEFGGRGLSLAQVAREQRLLAYHAPATALATNMHLYWTGIAADLFRSGDTSCQWILEEAARGAVFAAGHGETGNDFPVLASSARAERVDGGYRFYGHKIFGSLTPVWTYLGIHATDASDPENPKIVHAFMPRDTEGYTIKDTWDTLGMRATASQDTILDGAFVSDAYIPRVIPAGLAGADLFILSLFAWALVNFGSIYCGLAERARDLAVDQVKQKSSVAMGGRSLAYNPMTQYAMAEMSIELERMRPQIERIAEDWSTGVDHGGEWPAKIVAAKYSCVEGAKKVVDLALDVTGGAGMFKRNELERLYRDVRCGGFHPANAGLTHEIVGKTTLGILGEEPRWG